MARSVIDVDITPDYIAIHDIDRELIAWNRLEWEDDPDTVSAIVSTVKLAYTNPSQLRHELGYDDEPADDEADR